MQNAEKQHANRTPLAAADDAVRRIDSTPAGELASVCIVHSAF
jgi:hypothetical protein